MTSFSNWTAQISELAETVNAIEPDPRYFLAKTLPSIARRVESEVLPGAHQALGRISDLHERQEVATSVVGAISSAAALFIVDGQLREATRWLDAIAPLSADTPQKDVIKAARRGPLAFGELYRATWHLRAGHREWAEGIASPLAGREDAIGAQAARILALKELGRTANNKRAMVAVVVIVMVAAGGYLFERWRTSPARRLGIAVEEVQKYEQRTDADKEAALERYEALLRDYEAKVDVEEITPAALVTAERIVSRVEQPLTRARLVSAQRAMTRFFALPQKARQAAAEFFVERVRRWAAQLISGKASGQPASAKQGDQRSIDAAVGLLSRAGPLHRFLSSNSAVVLIAQKQALALGVAETLANKGWVLDAIERFARVRNRKAVARAAQLLSTVFPRTGRTHSAIWLQLEPSVERFGAHVDGLGLLEHQSLVKRARHEIAAAKARTRSSTYKTLLSSTSSEALQKALVATPHDQQLASRLAMLLYGTKKSAEALALFAKLEKPGMLVQRARVFYAALLIDVGRLPLAARLLQTQLDPRLPSFELARRRYKEALDARMKELAIEAQRDIPHDLTKLRQQNADRDEAYRLWVARRLEKDANMETLRKRLAEQKSIVRVAVMLGTVKLRQAAALAGAARRRYLVEAESVFLAIQGYASSVSYYLGLGQVYYRLGKRAAAHKQFDRLLAKKDAWIALRVVRAYRVLGAIERARSTAEMVYRDYDKRYRKEAALTIGIIAHDLDKKIEWLRRADQKDAVVRTMLLNAEGKQLLRKGRLVAADKKFAQVVAYFKPRSLHGMAAANNAAGAAWNRYKCTGDGHHLDQAIELYEQALKLEPDNALVMANLMWSLSDRVWHSAFRELADRKALVRMNIDFDHALNALYAGPERPRLLSRMRQHPDLQRVFSLAAQVATLAPSRPAPYKSELLWLSKTRQLEALTRFAKRLEGVKLDFTDSHAAAKRRYSRAGDARSLADAKRDLAKLKKIVLRSSASKKLRASLLLEKAIALETIAWKARDLEAAKQVDRLRMRVKALDSAMGVVRQRVDNLVFIALLDAAKQSDRVGRFIDKHHHGLGGIYLLYVMKQKERALVSLILTRPAFKKALKLCARHLNDNAVEVEAKDVMLAELANDRWLLERTKRFKTDPAKRLLARVYRKLYPYRPMYAVRLSLFER